MQIILLLDLIERKCKFVHDVFCFCYSHTHTHTHTLSLSHTYTLSLSHSQKNTHTFVYCPKQIIESWIFTARCGSKKMCLDVLFVNVLQAKHLHICKVKSPKLNFRGQWIYSFSLQESLKPHGSISKNNLQQKWLKTIIPRIEVFK